MQCVLREGPGPCRGRGRAVGITWSSSGGYTTRSNPTCTSFDGLRQASGRGGDHRPRPLDPGSSEDREPAWLPGYGPVPGGWVRDLLAASDEGTKQTLRRFHTHPRTNELVAMDACSRSFPAGLRRLSRLRDQSCRTPWCDAPVRHADHVVPREAGGETSAANGQGLCEQCNYTKQAPGWRSVVAAAQPHQVVTTTPTGHAYRSRAPGQPGALPKRTSRLEISFRDLVLEAA